MMVICKKFWNRVIMEEQFQCLIVTKVELAVKNLKLK